MIQNASIKSLLAMLVLALTATAAEAVVIDLVPVGNTLNTGELSGLGAGGYGPDRICGAVDYAYSIGTYEVTAGQYTAFLNAVADTDTYGLYNSNMWSDTYGCKIQQSGSSGTYSYSVASDWADRPVNYVSFWDAARFANWLNNGQGGEGTTEYGAYHDIGNQSLFGRNAGALFFIPTEDEWYKAAYHENNGNTGDYFYYPTSSDLTPSNDLIDPDPGNNATFYDSGYTIGGPYYRTEVGAHENSASPYGTFDQGGNVWEWNETAIFGSYRGLRGGSFYYSYDYTLHASYRDGNHPTHEYSEVGFRVASNGVIPEPASVLVWCGLGVVGLVWWRRRK